jgi:hypothetical protein
MKNRVKRGWLFLGMGALAVLLVVVALVVSAGAGPNEIAVGPEEYHIYDGRAGIQIEAEVINASRDVVIMEDPQYIGPVTMITFGLSPMSRHTEIYDHNGYVLSKLTTTTTIRSEDYMTFDVVDADGNIVGKGDGSGLQLDRHTPLHPLYSYQLGSAITPYWLALLQQN